MQVPFAKVFRLSLLLSCAALGAESAPAPASAVGTTIETSRSPSGLVFIPYANYNPETSVAFGVIALNYFQATDTVDVARPSKLRTLLQYSLKKQFWASLRPEIFLDDGHYRLTSEVAFVRFPNTWYGIGPSAPGSAAEDFSIQYKRLGFGLRRRQWEKLEFGVLAEWEWQDMLSTQPGGLLASGRVSGSNGGLVSGAGLIASWDDRDFIFSPTSGGYYEVSSMFYGAALGSVHSFQRYRADLRHFYPAYRDHVVGLQFVAVQTNGDVPFTHLALLGGDRMMRGYLEGRYRDRAFAGAQAEYRAPLFWRLGAAAFAGVGNVAPTLGEIFGTALKPSYGLGLRYAVDTQQKINARLDVGAGSGNAGFYLQIEESF